MQGPDADTAGITRDHFRHHRKLPSSDRQGELGAVGETSQLQAIAALSNGETVDVTNVASWIPMTPVIRVSKGLVTAEALGYGQVNAVYGGKFTAKMVTVTPPGTYLIRGFVMPGHDGDPDFLGIPGFRVVDTNSGRTTMTSATGAYAPGWYTLGGLNGTTRIAFDKNGYEPAELVVTGPAINGGGGIQVQRLYRITAGETVQTTIATQDVAYDVGSSDRCVNCRLIRVVNPTAGTLHLALTWNLPSAALALWVNGQRFVGSPGGPLNVDVPVSAGELVLYAGVGTGDFGPCTITLTTSLTAPNS
jgi:hypothetical protein